METVLRAPIVAYPLGLFDCCPVSDGAAAAIVVRADMAKNFRPDPIYVSPCRLLRGLEEGFMNPAYDYAHVEETRVAGARAYTEAGISDPEKEISVAEVHDCFTITELTIMEDLLFSKPGKAPEDIEAGKYELTGRLPVTRTAA